MKIKVILLFVFCSLLFTNQYTFAQEPDTNKKESVSIQDNEKLVVLWTSADAEVAKKMVFLYTFNAKKYEWWKDITFIIWGPSTKLLSEDTELQDNIKKMKELGIKLESCKWCSDQYGVSDQLIELGVDVKYMGTVLTEYIKSEKHVITF
jgi:hypothetical protein